MTERAIAAEPAPFTSRFDEEARAILAVASRLEASPERPAPHVTPSAILTALVFCEDAMSRFVRSQLPHDTVARLEAEASFREGVASDEPPPEVLLLSPGTWSEDAVRLVDDARGLALATQAEQIGARHLLGALLVDREAPLFALLDVDAAALLERFLSFVTESFPHEKDRWRWPPASERRAVGSSRPPVPQDDAAHPADIGGQIHVAEPEGHADQAQAFAQVLSSRQLAPPLFVGLFGDWGSGKTFFMQSIRRRIDAINAVAPDEGGAVVQIELNASHYGSGDITADLAHRIVSQLLRVDATKVGSLLDRLGASTNRKGASASLKEAKGRLAIAKAKRADDLKRLAKQRVTVRELARSAADVRGSELLEDLEGEIVETLSEGVAAAGMPLDDAARARLAQSLRGASLRGTRDVVQLAVEEVRSASWGRVVSALVVGAVVVVPALVLSAMPLPVTLRAIAGAVAAISTIATFLLGVRPHGERSVQIARAAAKTFDTIEAGAAARKRALDKDLAEAERELEKETAVLERQKEDLAKVESEVADARAALDATKPERRRQLLDVETSREAFEKLSLLLGGDALPERRGKLLAALAMKEEDLPRIRRVVVYADDLDRLPSDRVNDVVQALHLFLSSPLFVVLCAVDARWASESSGPDYLEKIFQIPFWIPEMDRRVADNLFRDVWDATPREVAVPSFRVLQLESREVLSAHERAFAEQLAAYLGPSPRLKRFATVYRLLKTSLSKREWEAFAPADAEAVLLLLAVLTGAPNLAPEVLDDLANQRLVDGRPAALSEPRAPGGARPVELERALALVGNASALGPELWQKLEQWAPRVARYSFRRALPGL